MSDIAYHLPVKLLGMLLLTMALAVAAPVWGEQQVPVPGMVTMIDLGADSCLPCRLMIPIMEELKQAYQGKVAIVFIDVYRQNALARRFHPMVTPTQIFFDRQGKEVSRHEGFLDKDSIVKELDAIVAEK